jgi:3-oxoacyl-[acyl-carrier protein] reductase
MNVDLRDKVALVTGAANGIGKAIAESLAANEARVVFSDIDFAAVQKSAFGVPMATAMELDVCSESQIEAVTTEIMREYGRLDILVNNAGINTWKLRVPFDQFPREEWDRIMQVDLTGVYLVGKAVGRIMRAQRSGRIINIASVAGLVPLRLQCAYVAAKAGVVNLTKAMALEVGCEGITVNAIAPGSTLTEGTRSLFYGENGQFKDSVQKLLDHIPCGRPGRPEEIAAAALFLAAPEASYVNGAVLSVDGGWTAGYAREF